MTERHANKFLKFLKSNIYYLLVVLALAIMVTVIAVTNVNAKTEDVNSEIEDEKGGITDVSTPNVENYRAPLDNFTILKKYSDSELMYNASLKRWEAHKSMDLEAEENSKVMAIASGKVTQVYTNYLEGTVVVIEHNNGMKSLYGSLNENVNVSVGDSVTQGQVIGNVGCTANSEYIDKCHLYFELFRDGVKVDPAEYIPFSDK